MILKGRGPSGFSSGNLVLLGAPHRASKKRKEKIMPVSQYRHECEHVSPMLIMVSHDAL
jgi:hypothetical protein